MTTSYWVSFATAGRFRGLVLVDQCETISDALHRISCAGVNPGGQAAGFPFDPNDRRVPIAERRRMKQLPRLVLLSRAALMASGIKIGPPVKGARLDRA